MKLSVLLIKPPYGDIQAAEAVRHAMGAIGDEIDVTLLLVDDGVYLAKKGQDVAESGYTELGESVSDLIDMGCSVLVEKNSMREAGLDTEDIIENVKVVTGYEISETIKESDKTMIF
ncbi:MAG: DsrE family protein [Nitrospirae bacterium]|nr:DsrE family protein [Nitrospirota bacterium]